MSNATKCDRCGTVYKGIEGIVILPTRDGDYDICADCAKALEGWMEHQPVTDAPERVTNDGEMSHDTREQLEANVRQILHSAYMLAWMHGHENRRGSSFEKLHVEFYNLLDRQAAITERETLHSHPMCAGSDACPALNRPIGESADRETPDTAGIGASKDEIRDFDVWDVAYEIYCAGGYVDNGNEPNPPTDGIRELLDRQAAITERECMERSTSERIGFDCAECAEGLGRELEARCYHLKARIAELNAERDEWKTKCETREFAYKQADAERKRYSEQIDELRAERNEWKGLAEKYRADSIAAQAECEGYRAKLGAVLDAIREAERAAR